MRERGAVLKRVCQIAGCRDARKRAVCPRPASPRLLPRRWDQPRALRAELPEFFHCPMLSVMIFTEASAACVACA
jgi:hypothetical protein